MAAPAAGFNVFSGTSGDFQVATIAPTAGLDVVTIPASPPALTSVLELSKWSFTDSLAASAEFVGFGGPADALMVLGKIPLVGGVSDWILDLEGALNGNSGAGLDTYSRLQRGKHVLFNVVVQKVSGYGHRGYLGKILEIGSDADVESNKPTSVKIKIKGQGLLTPMTFAP